MNLKILVTTICLTPLYLTNFAVAQQLPNSTTMPPTTKSLSSISQLERLLVRQLEQKSPLFYLLLIELEKYQPPQSLELQQQAEEELLEILQRPKPLQKRLIEQQ